MNLHTFSSPSPFLVSVPLPYILNAGPEKKPYFPSSLPCIFENRLQQQAYRHRCSKRNLFSSSSFAPPPQKYERSDEEDVKFVRGKHLSELSTWGIGGPAKFFYDFSNQTQLLSAIRYCSRHSIQFLVIGKGSNCLFDDHGFDGCIMLNRINFLEKIEPCIYRVGSGYPVNRLGMECSNKGLAGLEFACGIPGTVGGAAFMNAGANGQEIADVIDSVEIVTIKGEHSLLKRSECTFSYRKSPFQDMKDLVAIVAVTFRLTPSIQARKWHHEYLSRRRKTQPIGEQSAGSVFRNPLDSELSAGEMIEKAGLKGYRVGGAKVSDLHANFFINFNKSTSKDMLELIRFVKGEVYRKFGIKLKEEIRYIPYHWRE